MSEVTRASAVDALAQATRAPVPGVPLAFVRRVLNELARPDAVWRAGDLMGAVIDTCASRDDVADLVLLGGAVAGASPAAVLAHAEQLALEGPRRSLEVALSPPLAAWRGALEARGYVVAYTLVTMARTLGGLAEAPAAPWRPLRPEDLPAYHALVVEAFAELPGAMVPPLPVFAAHALAHEPPPELLFDGDTPVAFVRVAQTADGEGELASLGVAGRARGRGLGHAVVARGLALLRARGATRATLDVAAINARATALYRSHGFETTAETPVWRKRLR